MPGILLLIRNLLDQFFFSLQSQPLKILNVTEALTKDLLTGNKLFSDPACFGGQGTFQKPLPLSEDMESYRGRLTVRLALAKVCKENVTILLTLEAITLMPGLSFSIVDEVKSDRKGAVYSDKSRVSFLPASGFTIRSVQKSLGLAGEMLSW